MTHRFHRWIALEHPRLGTRVSFATDEFFAAKERLIDPAPPVFRDGVYDDHGKWMDGWESRRRRTPGHDYCVVRLGVPGIVHGVNVDTRHFTGNYPPEVSIEACVSRDDVPEDGWETVLARTPIDGDADNLFDIENEQVITHLRLSIFPDGGVARLRIYGEVVADFTGVNGYVDLLAVENGGRAIACSDEHYGSMHNLNAPGRGINMGDGWETARRRGPGNDWVIVALGAAATIERAEVDTGHFKGNYPDRVSLEAGCFDDDAAACDAAAEWRTLLPESKLKMDQQHYFESLQPLGDVTHVRMSIYPDGGVSRLRLFGKVGE